MAITKAQGLLKMKSAGIVKEDPLCLKASSIVLPVFIDNGLAKVVKKIEDENIKKPQDLFNKYCMSCHGEDGSATQLPLGALDKLANYTSNKLGPQERLEKGTMPPHSAKNFPTPEERKEMIKVLSDLKSDSKKNKNSGL